MENAVDALKMAGAAMLFILAFSLAMIMFEKARSTSDAVLARLETSKYLEKIQPLDNNVTREVGIETVIPTLYRYSQSDANISIRIICEAADPGGVIKETEHQIFDTEIESDVIEAARTVPNSAEDTPYKQRLRLYYNDPNKLAYLFQAPWLDQKDKTSYKIERINAYIYGKKATHMKNVTYEGTKEGVPSGLLNIVNKNKEENPLKRVIFEESYVEQNISGNVEKDEYGEEIVTKPVNSQIVITYKLKVK